MRVTLSGWLRKVGFVALLVDKRYGYREKRIVVLVDKCVVERKRRRKIRKRTEKMTGVVTVCSTGSCDQRPWGKN